MSLNRNRIVTAAKVGFHGSLDRGANSMADATKALSVDEIVDESHRM